MKTIFLGTPEVAVPFLETLHKYTEVALVITQPDRPRGRGMVITPCPVKLKAQELGLKVLSPEKITEIEAEIKAANADYGIAVAYGQILKQHIIDIPRLGIINLHFSILPNFRGAAPVQHSLFAGVEETGVTAFWIDQGMDTGPIFLNKTLEVSKDDNCKTLFAKLIPLGDLILRDVIENIRMDNIIKRAQTYKTPVKPAPGAITIAEPEMEELPIPSYAPMIKKEDTILDFNNMAAEVLHNRVRGLACGPNAKALITVGGVKDVVQILETLLSPLPDEATTAPGTVVSIESDGKILVKCYQGFVYIKTLRPAGKKDMPAAAFANGHKIKAGDVIFY
ncbi:methionyl-tRNA formyltransferase [Elusimicrobium simillimum]|uniref:methionyl-tRNA formyltransferase n=1 Tax=Elusimicrobium simillimum TaxID=3143438 RepID=UPI003C6EB652